MRYRKVILLMTVVISVCEMTACGTTTEENYAIEDGNLVYDTEESTETEDTSETEVTETRHQIGETVEFNVDGGGEVAVTITDWGTSQSSMGTPMVFFNVTMENTGDTTVTASHSLFDIYVDDVRLTHNITESGLLSTGEISPGRKAVGTVYGEGDGTTAETIEVECGGSVFVLKDGSEISDGENRNVVSVDEDTSGSVNLPSDMKVDYEKIEYASLSGNYGGMQGMSSIDLNMYSSPEENSVGNADVYVQGGEYSYSGEIAEVATNVYKVANTDGQEVLLAISTEIAEYDPGEDPNSEGTLWIQLYVDGQLIEEYMMLEHYES